MLLGANGSGKTTILSSLHVYKDSFDDRKNLIIEGEEGRKEVDVLHDGHLYEIVHIYAKTPQSFIKKDGTELNENGGVRSFEDIVNKELGVSREYFNIGKIGSNTKSFVDFTASERKNYIGNFLNIESILEKHKLVSDKQKSLKKSIATIANELGKHPEKSIIETEIKQLTDLNDISESEISKLFLEQGSLTAQIERNEKDLSNLANISDLESRMAEKKVVIDENTNIKNKLESELSDLADSENQKNILTEDIGKLETDIQVNLNEKNNKILLITDIQNRASALEIELKSLGNPEDIKKLEDEIETQKGEIEKISKSLKENKYGEFTSGLVFSQEKKDINKMLTKFSYFMDFIEKYFNELSRNSFSLQKSNIEYFFDDSFSDSFKRQISESRTAISNKKNMLEKEQKKLAQLESHITLLENLEKRPKTCTIDSCPFIEDAIKYKNVINDISDTTKNIASLKTDLENLEIKSENLQEMETLYKNFLNEYNNVMPRENDIYIKFIQENNLIDRLKGSLNDFRASKEEMCESIATATVEINNFIIAKRKLSMAENSKKVLEGSDLSLKEKYERDLRDYQNRLSNLKNDLNDLTVKGESLEKTLTEKRQLLEKYNLYLQSVSKLNSASTMFSTTKTELESAKKIIENQGTLRDKLNDVISKLNVLSVNKKERTEKLKILESSLKLVENLLEKQKELNDTFEPISLVESALSPIKGIPLILMKVYLEETESIANELLDIAFGGEFNIKFITTEKEFAIQVNSKGNTKADIKMASQGEIAITTISLSLALIEQAISEYNIVCLDEIDGPLDSGNRSNFINILNGQITKLGIEQVFIISHNNAFDSADMDLILLKGHNVDKDNAAFMKNKNILFEAAN